MQHRTAENRPEVIEAPPLGRHYEVGGRRLMLHRSGSGGPAVVFLPGAGLVGLDFLNLQQRAAELATSVLYDRAGTGWSERTDLPRSAVEVAGELRDLLRAAGVPAPYLLVGHSLGAFYARRFAQLFPDEVAGLLLLDPGHEDIHDHMPAEAARLDEQMKLDPEQLPELTDEQVEASRGALAQIYAEWAGSIREPLVEHHLSEWRTGIQETANFESELYDELRQGGELPDAPLIVVTAMGRNPYWAKFASGDLERRMHDGVRDLHAAIAASVPRGEQRVLDDAQHQYLHIEYPDAVLHAIRDLLDEAGE
ncbi:alpha/beta fold hydrolase [Saccharopolyspora shandongensis]|uniref:alpha/beta fold hydrolase n=1 Tax=Saccharopolyspora shandongensis TaxID=418495 RepID=UPI0033D4B4CB